MRLDYCNQKGMVDWPISYAPAVHSGDRQTPVVGDVNFDFSNTFGCLTLYVYVYYSFKIMIIKRIDVGLEGCDVLWKTTL